MNTNGPGPLFSMSLGTIIVSGQILSITKIELFDYKIHFVAVAQSDVVIGPSEEVRIYGKDATLIGMMPNWPTTTIRQTWGAGTVFEIPLKVDDMRPSSSENSHGAP